MSQFKLFLCGWLRACLTVYWFITLTWKVKCLKSLIFCFLLFSSSSRNRVCVRFHDLYIVVCRIYVRNSQLMPCLWYIFRLLALYARAQFRTPRVTYSVQFQNGSFWLNGHNIFHTVSLNFQRVVPGIKMLAEIFTIRNNKNRKNMKFWIGAWRGINPFKTLADVSVC